MAKKKIRILKRATAKFNLSYKVGEIAEIEEKQASELINEGYGELVKKPRKTKRKKTLNFIGK